jgi:hypothetical protein
MDSNENQQLQGAIWTGISHSSVFDNEYAAMQLAESLNAAKELMKNIHGFRNFGYFHYPKSSS